MLTGAKVKSSESTGRDGIAFGVASRPRNDDYRLAVRVFAKPTAKVASAVETLLRDVPDNERDVAFDVKYAPRHSLKAGDSCGHYQITAGTLGGFVEDDSNYYILSNNHVLANSKSVANSAAKVGDEIWEPGPLDVTNGHAVIANLSRWCDLDANDRMCLDAAVAEFSPAVTEFYAWSYEGIGQMAKTPIANRFSTSRVIKRGRKTKVTKGAVSVYSLSGVSINYGSVAKPYVVTYDDQIEIVGTPASKPFSQPGDSGSFILDADSLKPYALLYGGGPDSQGIDRTLAHFMPDVLTRLKVTIVQ
jgi:hypothetical protein